jgi:hypothetical protein
MVSLSLTHRSDSGPLFRERLEEIIHHRLRFADAVGWIPWTQRDASQKLCMWALLEVG